EPGPAADAAWRPARPVRVANGRQVSDLVRTGAPAVLVAAADGLRRPGAGGTRRGRRSPPAEGREGESPGGTADTGGEEAGRERLHAAAGRFPIRGPKRIAGSAGAGDYPLARDAAAAGKRLGAR